MYLDLGSPLAPAAGPAERSENHVREGHRLRYDPARRGAGGRRLFLRARQDRDRRSPRGHGRRRDRGLASRPPRAARPRTSRPWSQELRESAVCALARAVPGDVDAAGEAVRGAARPRIHVFVNASDVQLAQQLCKSRRRRLSAWRSSPCGRARGHCDDVEFSPMDATRADPDFVAEIVRVGAGCGRRGRSTFPDTVGYILPEQLAGALPRAAGARLRSSRKRCSPSTGRTISVWPPPTPSPPSGPARVRWRSRSTGSVSGPATPPSRRS